MLKLLTVLFDALEGEQALAKLAKVLKINIKDIKKIGQIKSSLKKGNPLTLKHLRGKISANSLKNVLPNNVFKSVSELPKAESKEIISEWKKGLKKEKKDQQTIDMMINYEGEIELSSSFLQYGIFEMDDETSKLGRLTLSMSGKEYDMGLVKTTIWIAMIQATGEKGSGAGSVLWNTIWYNRRTTTKVTGGVAGSLENLIKSKKRVYAQIARNAKLVNKFEGLRNSQKAAQIAKAQKTARKVRIRNKQRAQRRAR